MPSAGARRACYFPDQYQALKIIASAAPSMIGS
jgi:hypothetical protein